MAQSDEPIAPPRRSVPIEWHDARDVDLELAPTGPGGGQTVDLGKDDQATNDAASALKDAAKDAAKAKVASAFKYEPPDLVDTPGALQTIVSLWIFSLQKLSLQWYVGVEWPSWFLNFLGILGVCASGYQRSVSISSGP